MADQRLTHALAPELGHHEVAGVGDVGGPAREVGLEVVRAGESSLVPGHGHQRLVVQPVLLEIGDRQQADGLGVPLAGGEDGGEGVVQLVVVLGPGFGDVELQAAGRPDGARHHVGRRGVARCRHG